MAVAASAGASPASSRAWTRPALLASLALLALGLGTLVYLLDRPAGSAALLPAHWQSSPSAGANLFGAAGAWLPSFMHALGFSVLTALVLAWTGNSGALMPSRRASAAACAAWGLINSLAELGQHRAFYAALASGIEAAFGVGALARQVGRYFGRGVFDPADLLACLAGAGLAYALLRYGAAQPRRGRA